MNRKRPHPGPLPPGEGESFQRLVNRIKFGLALRGNSIPSPVRRERVRVRVREAVLRFISDESKAPSPRPSPPGEGESFQRLVNRIKFGLALHGNSIPSPVGRERVRVRVRERRRACGAAAWVFVGFFTELTYLEVLYIVLQCFLKIWSRLPPGRYCFPSSRRVKAMATS